MECRIRVLKLLAQSLKPHPLTEHDKFQVDLGTYAVDLTIGA